MEASFRFAFLGIFLQLFFLVLRCVDLLGFVFTLKMSQNGNGRPIGLSDVIGLVVHVSGLDRSPNSCSSLNALT